MSEFHGSGSLGSFTLSRPNVGSWRHKKSNLYKETLLDVAQSLKINAVDFNAAADAVVAHQQTEVSILHSFILPITGKSSEHKFALLIHTLNTQASIGNSGLAAPPVLHQYVLLLTNVVYIQEQRDVLLTADIGGTNCRFSLWQANTKVDVVYDEVFTKVRICVAWRVLHFTQPCVSLSVLAVHAVLSYTAQVCVLAQLCLPFQTSTCLQHVCSKWY